MYRIKINIRSAIPAYQRTLHKVVSIGCIATLRRFFRIIHLKNFIFSLSFQFEVFFVLTKPGELEDAIVISSQIFYSLRLSSRQVDRNCGVFSKREHRGTAVVFFLPTNLVLSHIIIQSANKLRAAGEFMDRRECCFCSPSTLALAYLIRTISRS